MCLCLLSLFSSRPTNLSFRTFLSHYISAQKIKILNHRRRFFFVFFFNPSRLQTLFLFESSQNTLIETRTHMYSEVHILDTKNTKILISKDCPLPFCQILYLIPYKRTLTFSVSFAVYHSSLSFSLSLSIYFLTHSPFLSPSSLPFPFEETKYLFSFILAACKWSVCTYVT